MKKLAVVSCLVLAMMVLIAIPSYAQQDQIWGCYQKVKGSFRIVTSPTDCLSSENPISWSSTLPWVPFENTVTVNCGTPPTINDVLNTVPGKPLTIIIRGTCRENVQITRDDVTLIADPSGGGVYGPDPTQHTIYVRASRTTITGLEVTGGRHGICVTGSATISSCDVHDAGQMGVCFYQGGHGSVDNSKMNHNGYSGFFVEGAFATVTNSDMSYNVAAGAHINAGGKSRIGYSDKSQYAGNTITNNKSNGVLVDNGGTVYLAANTITGNGTNLSAVWGCYGIGAFQANVDLIGANSISNNACAGIFARNSNVQIGDPGFINQPTYVNTITNNGFSITDPNSGMAGGGIYGFLNSSLDIRYATITGNIGVIPGPTHNDPQTVGPMGVTLNHSTRARMYGDMVDGSITIMLTSSLILQNPVVSVQGGLRCYGPANTNFFNGNTSGVVGGTDSCNTF